MFLDREATPPLHNSSVHARFDVDSRDPCLLVYTSGSTGAPKGALLHHSGIIDFANLCNSLWPLAPHRVINYFPINHIGSVVDCMMPCLVAGGAQIMLEQFDPAVCLELIERERITLWGSVPSVFQMQLALPDFARFDLSSVQLIAWGGAAMPRETIERLRSLCPNAGDQLRHDGNLQRDHHHRADGRPRRSCEHRRPPAPWRGSSIGR